ncbi:MAG: cupin domain-containing protein [Patescibacteria group bacterium]|nr:cupin domain-containing protein [Patescibacteria group bacterium]
MKFIKSSKKAWEEKKGYSKKIFLDEEDLHTPGARIQLIKIKPKETAKNHYHKKQTEISYFLNNNGFYIVNGIKQQVEAGDIIVIEPNDRHEVVNNTDSDFLYVVYKLNYAEDDLFWEK